MKTSNIEIIPSSQVDHKILFTLFEKIYSSTEFLAEDFNEKFPNFKEFQNYLMYLENQADCFCLVALLDQKPVGYMSLKTRSARKLRHAADLNMGILPDVRGQGIGQKLFQSTIEKSKSIPQLKILYLMVREDNESAVSIYKKNNFETVARLEKDTFYDGKYYTGLLMRLFVNQ